MVTNWCVYLKAKKTIFGTFKVKINIRVQDQQCMPMKLASYLDLGIVTI